MVDVGFPMYGQLQKVKGTLNGNTDVSADKPLQPAVSVTFHIDFRSQFVHRVHCVTRGRKMQTATVEFTLLNSLLSI